HSLDRHISTTWRMSTLLGNYVTPVPAQQRLGPYWYTGSADAIYQSLNLINDERPDLLVVVGADHVYRMDPRQIIDQHVTHGGGGARAGVPGPPPRAHGFRRHGRRRGGAQDRRFLGEPRRPPGPPRKPP